MHFSIFILACLIFLLSACHVLRSKGCKEARKSRQCWIARLQLLAYSRYNAPAQGPQNPLSRRRSLLQSCTESGKRRRRAFAASVRDWSFPRHSYRQAFSPCRAGIPGDWRHLEMSRAAPAGLKPEGGCSEVVIVSDVTLQIRRHILWSAYKTRAITASSRKKSPQRRRASCVALLRFLHRRGSNYRKETPSIFRRRSGQAQAPGQDPLLLCEYRHEHQP